MAHEFTHGVTQFTAGLIYQDQSGALNESVSDVFAAMTKQSSGQTRRPGGLADRRGTVPARDQCPRAPLDGEPGTAYDDPDRQGSAGRVTWRTTSRPPRTTAACTSTPASRTGRSPWRRWRSADASWEKAGQVWYDALTGGEVTARSDFTAFAQATINSAGRVFPDDPSVADEIREAWSEGGRARRPGGRGLACGCRGR